MGVLIADRSSPRVIFSVKPPIVGAREVSTGPTICRINSRSVTSCLLSRDVIGTQLHYDHNNNKSNNYIYLTRSEAASFSLHYVVRSRDYKEQFATKTRVDSRRNTVQNTYTSSTISVTASTSWQRQHRSWHPTTTLDLQQCKQHRLIGLHA